jgi:hypothetical protein
VLTRAMDLDLRRPPWIQPWGREVQPSGMLSSEAFLSAVEREIATKGYFRSYLELPHDGATVTITAHPKNAGTEYRVHAESGDTELLADFDFLEDAVRGANSLARRTMKREQKQQPDTPRDRTTRYS